MTDDDILSGIREASRSSAAWSLVGLDDPRPPLGDGAPLIAAFELHFGVQFKAGEIEQVTDVRGLVELLRQKFKEP